MKLLKPDDQWFVDYPKMKLLHDSGWVFFLSEYRDPHHGRPEEDYYVRSPRMPEDSRIYIRPHIENMDNVFQREIKFMAEAATDGQLSHLKKIVTEEYLKFFTENPVSKSPKLNVSVKVG